jgi:Predicted NAD/FAD-dependent oxidoreductase
MIDFCVLGTGISGSTIANLLSKKYSIQIIDKAKGIGGRASNKKIGKSISFDHGLQYYSAKDIKFRRQLNYLIKKKILKFLGR